MDKYPFIFSEKLRYRLYRHGSFWFAWWLFSSFLYSFSSGLLKKSYFQQLPVSALEAVLYLVPHIFLAYSLIYYATPRLLLKGKYLQTAVAVMGLFLITGFISSLISVYVLSDIRFYIFGIKSLPRHNEINLYLGLMAGLRGGITVGGMAAAIKLMKFWYVKEQRNLQLQKENISAQLQLLKAQVHPHFLFNTLNNIYSSTQVTSPEGANMIMGLSGLLRYMLYECNQPLVPLTREVKMLEEYIALEKIRYGNNLDINVELPPAETGVSIAPLLLLPFVENSFKHGTSNMLEQPWISLTITVEGDWLKMKLLNGMAGEEKKEPCGIGLKNVRQRLAFLYPDKHTLSITSEEEIFIVNLKLLLERTAETEEPAITQTAFKEYA
ncbi:MAG TPA: histidine kinase [Flavisolibacter sp.]|nr:histidine kinase [Flavisolibacter sp.]